MGSVLNYSNASLAIKEFQRILKPNGILVLEFERSDSGDLLFSKEHHKDIVETFYDFNNQRHTLLLYGEKYIENLLQNHSFKIIKKKRFHIISTLADFIGVKECINYKLIHLDPLFYFLGYKLAHNIILLTQKN